MNRQRTRYSAVPSLALLLLTLSPLYPAAGQATCGEIITLLAQGFSVAEISEAVGLSPGVIESCARQQRLADAPRAPRARSHSAAGPAPLGAAGPAPIGAAGPAPIGAAGPAPIGAAGPAPLGAAGPPPHGAPGPPPLGAAGPAPGH